MSTFAMNVLLFATGFSRKKLFTIPEGTGAASIGRNWAVFTPFPQGAFMRGRQDVELPLQ
jgi:hypothetical protein